MAETTVNQTGNGQYKVTVPKDIGDIIELDGKKVRWTLGSAGNKLQIEIIDD